MVQDTLASPDEFFSIVTSKVCPTVFRTVPEGVRLRSRSEKQGWIERREEERRREGQELFQLISVGRRRFQHTSSFVPLIVGDGASTAQNLRERRERERWPFPLAVRLGRCVGRQVPVTRISKALTHTHTPHHFEAIVSHSSHAEFSGCGNGRKERPPFNTREIHWSVEAAQHCCIST